MADQSADIVPGVHFFMTPRHGVHPHTAPGHDSVTEPPQRFHIRHFLCANPRERLVHQIGPHFALEYFIAPVPCVLEDQKAKNNLCQRLPPSTRPALQAARVCFVGWKSSAQTRLEHQYYLHSDARRLSVPGLPGGAQRCFPLRSARDLELRSGPPRSERVASEFSRPPGSHIVIFSDDARRIARAAYAILRAVRMALISRRSEIQQ